MKPKLIHTAALFFALFLASCNSPQARYVIGVSQCSNDAWREKMNNEMLTEALLYDGVHLEIRSADNDSGQQTADIAALIDLGVDLLVVAPNEAIPITPVVEEAYKKGIPVIVVDRKILSDSYTAYVGADNYQIGKVIGEYVVQRLHGRGRIVELTGLGGSTPAIDRHQGFLSVINRHEDIFLLCSEDARWQQEDAERKTDSLLRTYPHTDLFFAHNDPMAYGAYLAAGRTLPGRKPDFIGIDGLPGAGNGIDLVRRGIFDATFIYPTGGDQVIATAMNILQGRPFNRETLLSTAIVDSTNASVLEMQTRELLEQQKKINLFRSKVDDYLLRYSTLRIFWWSSIVCLLFVAAILVVMWRTVRSKSRLNRELLQRNDEITRQKEQLEEHRDRLIELSRRLEEATQAKLVFFTNISHDFRTPLTLIADPIEHLLADESLTDNQRFHLRMARKNAQILLRMVDQILDFRKYENGKLHLKRVPIDLHGSLETWNASFRAFAHSRRMRFDFLCDAPGDFRMNADGEKIERAYFNILSNAFKFTPSGGTIRVRLARNDKTIRIRVTNSGSYIAPEETRRIFDRFYQADRSNTGSGIGLALAKAFVEMHGGKIEVASSPEAGTSFTIVLPFSPGPTAETPTTEFTGTLPEIRPQAVEIDMERPDPETDPAGDESPRRILIIDDNEDIRNYLRRMLHDEFVVTEACDGDEGYERAVEEIPDIIISDVMMPRSDGIECCNRLKQELKTCHIPVILLTACSLDEQRIEGLNNGADAYLSKPFHTGVLMATIRSLLDNRTKLQLHYGNDPLPIIKSQLNDMDNRFIERVRMLIEENLDNPDFSVEDFGRSVGMSHAQLYRKIKALTDYSPNEYVRIMRLKQAAALLASSETTVSEVAYRVGFSSPSYFAKCFRRLYGEAPVDYQRRMRS